MKKIGFVVPWFGENIPGGAESEYRGLTKALHNRGTEVEILTTCVEKFMSDWSTNFYKEGLYDYKGIPIKRFKVRKRDTKRFDEVNYKLMNNIDITLEEEKTYFDEMIYSQGLFDYIKRKADDYHCFVFIPYMFGTTYWGSQICPEKSVLIPCLHDESYARMTLIKEMFSNVAGCTFLAEAEYKLAKRLYNLENCRVAILGAGMETNFEYDISRFRNKYAINGDFILYAGRKDKGKNVDTLIKYFRKCVLKDHLNIKLVLIGGGEIFIPEDISEHVFDLGFVPIQDKYDAYASAMLLCQPSTNESFSLVIMESWLANRPVMVNAKCDVTKDFAVKSNGGLFFNNYDEFLFSVRFLLDNKDTADLLGKNGHKFVKSNFTWDIINERYTEYFRNLYEED